MKLQEDIDHLGCYARNLDMKFQPVCNIMQIKRKRIKKINVSYTFDGTVLDTVMKIKNPDITIIKDSKWDTHASNICTNAYMTIGFLSRIFTLCHRNVKELAYKGLVRPVLEYVSSPKVYFFDMKLKSFSKRQLDS